MGASDFFFLLPQAMRYPLRGSGGALLVAGTVVFWGLSLLRVPFVNMVIAFFAVCYVCAYLFRIVVHSAAGEKFPPIWPEFVNWYDDMVRPLGLMLAALCVAAGPAAIYRAAAYMLWGGGGDVMFAMLLLAGAVYAPMAILAVAMFDQASAARPAVVVPAIRSVGKAYFATCGLLAGAMFIAGVIVSRLLGAMPILGWLFGIAVMLYLLTAQMHILGLIYACHEKELEWFTME